MTFRLTDLDLKEMTLVNINSVNLLKMHFKNVSISGSVS